MSEPSLLAPVAQDPFADLSFPELQVPPVDDTFAFEDFNLDDLDLDVDFDLDLFAADGQLSQPPPLATSSSSAPSPERGSSSSSAGGDGGLRNEDSSESSSRSATGKDSCGKGKGDGAEEDEAKRRARLVRNRESAHLSRQRKKQYVEELEGTVKAMQATIADLSARISCVTAENAALKEQLGGAAGGAPPPLPMYPAVYPLPMPWVHPAYAMRGSQVPLVPIPRLKFQQPTPASEPPAKKPRKTKKVASVSLLGLLCLVMVCGCLIPAVNRMYGTIDTGGGFAFGPSHHHGRVLAVEGPSNSVLEGTDPKPPKNASETLPALLYLPRNGKHVKINGNLVIKSIVASEEASSRMSRYDEKSHRSQRKEETSLAIPGNMAPLEAGEAVEPTAEVKNKLMALAPGDANMYREDDGLIPQWFSEAMSGPMLSSGMCTEVFQFDVSPSSTHANGIVPVSSNSMASSSQNFTENLPSGQPQKVKNRRILYSGAIPLKGSTSNDTEHLKAHPKNETYARSKPVSSMVVSILADPREAGDRSSDGRISSKSLSRIFVVVLIDSVKYVTYSCVLPFKNHSPHL